MNKAKNTFYLMIVAVFAAGVFFTLAGVFEQDKTFFKKEFVAIDFAFISEIIIASNKGLGEPIIPGEDAFDIGESILGEPLANPPSIVRAIYLTGWSASSESRIEYAISLAERTPINAVVIDIKDFSGIISYDIDLPSARLYGANTNRIRDLAGLVKRFHDNDVYVIARITIFQDPVLAVSRPDLAVHSSSTGGLWYDNKGLAWIDPAAEEAWDYNIAIAKDVLRHGVDEINLDYIRFPSDGNMRDVVYSHQDGTEIRRQVIKRFFEHFASELPDALISADLFGLSTVNEGDLGIGQVIEDSYEFFGVVAPMVYPSHYAPGFLGFAQPAIHPYDVVFESMRVAGNRLREFLKQKHGIDDFVDDTEKLSNDDNNNTGDGFEENGTTTEDVADEGSDVDLDEILKTVKLRPWLQDFDLGATYDAEKVSAQIRATRDALGEMYAGYMLWSPRNIYTEGGIIE